ncbi:MAG: exo-alpha-sialidase [Planctomycetales bacterium]
MRFPHSITISLGLTITLLVASFTLRADAAPPNARGANAVQAELISVRKIWDAAPHNAFTDLLRFHDRWFCVFREGERHVSPDGALRVITSQDGEHWTSAALIKSAKGDLRDAKIRITADDRLMLCGAVAYPKGSPHRHQSLAWFSKNGTNWSEETPIAEPDYWLWRVTRQGDDWYGMGYETGPQPRNLRLYVSRDGGKKYETLVPHAGAPGDAGETSILFLPDKKALCLLRRDGKELGSMLGTSQPPYTDWNWKNVGIRIGGPHLIQLPDGGIIAGGRSYTEQGARTSLWIVDPDELKLTPLMTLPSRGDTSYPGFVWFNDRLWTSYYSSHEGKTSIYVAEIRLGSSLQD